jgi:hypothetical protein
LGIGNGGALTLNLSIPAAIDHFIVRCLYVLGYGIGSAVVDTLLPLAIGIVATGVIGFAAFAVYKRLSSPRRRRKPLGV